MCLEEINLHESGECDVYCIYCGNELPPEVPLDEFIRGNNEGRG